jgi:hypothetical protein
MKSDALAKSLKRLERVKGIEPSYSAWKTARALPRSKGPESITADQSRLTVKTIGPLCHQLTVVCQIKPHNLALRRHVSTRFVQERGLKGDSNSRTCEIGAHHFTLARNPRKHCVSSMHPELSWIERYPPKVEATRSNRVGRATVRFCAKLRPRLFHSSRMANHEQTV